MIVPAAWAAGPGPKSLGGFAGDEAWRAPGCWLKVLPTNRKLPYLQHRLPVGPAPRINRLAAVTAFAPALQERGGAEPLTAASAARSA
jgi:hypothetical protein